jgi:hypothetical protein
MSTFPYKNPISSEQLNGVQSVQRSEVFGTNFSVLSVGGYMEVFNLSDLNYTINGLGPIEYSGNTIPIDFLKGTGAPWSPDVLTLNSDNISSGRRRLGMLVYVYEVDQVYQYRIDNYESLWTAATASPGTVVISDFGTTVYNSSVDGQNFINAWTASTIEDVSGYTHSTAVWKKYTISGANLSELYLPLSGGTVSGNTYFTSGLTATTISATTYYNLPTDVFVTGGTYTSGNAIFTNNTGGTFTVTGFAVGGGGGQLFYLNLSQSQGSNRLLSTTGSTASQQTTGVTINNGVTGSIASFQSQPLNITLLPGGIWSFYLHSYKQNTNASFDIFVEVYKRTSGGTQTLLFSTDPTPVTTNLPNPSMQLSDSYFSGTTLLVSDSIVATVRATNTGNQSHTITLVTEGSTHYSYVVSTIPTQQGITCDTLSGCTIIQTIQTDLTNKLDKSGGTISGGLVVNSGLTATTISATTYQGLPYNITQSTSGTTITGGPSISITAILPANTITNSEATIEFISKFFGAGGTGVGYLYVNTSNTLLGASLLATGSASFAATGFGMLARTMNYTESTIKTLTASANFPSDYTSTGVSSVSFNPAVTNYFMFTVSGGPAFCQSYRITIY